MSSFDGEGRPEDPDAGQAHAGPDGDKTAYIPHQRPPQPDEQVPPAGQNDDQGPAYGQQPYGQGQPYGAPPSGAGPRHGNRTPLFAAIAVVVVAGVVVLILALTGAFSGDGGGGGNASTPRQRRRAVSTPRRTTTRRLRRGTRARPTGRS